MAESVLIHHVKPQLTDILDAIKSCALVVKSHYASNALNNP